VREAQEVEGLRLPEPFTDGAGREAAELDQAGLLGCSARPNVAQPLPQVAEDRSAFGVPLEADDGVVGIADDDDLDGRLRLRHWSTES
jgi:hypothetical protein